ncbi:hypothetical protein V5799_003678 [Amblyomma americanum]|uniref:Uncharacterized protein n=1 Tax=Amblyomma americanum TaxID=6943 RepID=A0AAQ4D8A1_AMBAM
MPRSSGGGMSEPRPNHVAATAATDDETPVRDMPPNDEDGDTEEHSSSTEEENLNRFQRKIKTEKVTSATRKPIILYLSAKQEESLD